MSTTLRYIHIGIAEGNEIGIHFERVDDASGARATGRAFVTVDARLLAPVIAAAEAALTAEVESVAALPPGAVTTALMQKRNAMQEAQAAMEQKRIAEQARSEAETAKNAALAALDDARAQKAAIEAALATAKAKP